MPTREEMQSLAQEIVRSYEDRTSVIAQLREAVKVELGEFQSSRIAMGTELRAGLAKTVADMKVAVGTQLKELDAAHGTMSSELKAELAKVRPALAEQDRKRQGDACEFKGELARAVAEGKAAVKAQLSEFDSAHKAMGREMRAELARGRLALAEGEKKRQSEAREFKGELARVVAEGKAATQARLKELAGIQAGARDEWQELAATMQAKRGVPVAEGKAVAEVHPDFVALRHRVFAYLADRPDGTRMTELEREFGIARIKMAWVIKNLMDEGKVKKQDLLYFAI